MKVSLKKRLKMWRSRLMMIIRNFLETRINLEHPTRPQVSRHKLTRKKIPVLKWSSMITTDYHLRNQRRRRLSHLHYKIRRTIIIAPSEWQRIWSRIRSSKFTQLTKKGVFLRVCGNRWDHNSLKTQSISTLRLKISILGMKGPVKGKMRSEMHICPMKNLDHHLE